MVKLSRADADLLREARERFQAGLDADLENRKRDEQDRKFYKGEQWADTDVKARAGRPTLTINRLPQFVKQVTGEMRQNKPAIKVLPVDDKTDPKLAEVYSAIIRHIESTSDGHRIYSKAAEQAVIGGIGWFRILTDYLEDTSFEQEILIKPVRNPLSVVVDPDARELCKQDMNWAFITELVSRKKFEKAYPGVSLAGFESPNEEYSQWVNGDFVRTAEYWWRETEKRTLALFSDGSTSFYKKGDDDIIRQANEVRAAAGAPPLEIARTREVDGYKVHSQLMNGVSLLGDERSDWAGRWIPLVPVIGEEVEVGDEVFRHGLFHHSKDAQRSYNFARSAMIEHVAAQPKAPYVGTAKQIGPYKEMWENANKGNPSVLIYEADPQAPGAPQRSAPPTMATAWYQEAQVADQDMKATTGIYDSSLGQRSNETSGRAIMARERQGDTATFVYIDNTSASIRHAGNILIDLIPHIYSDERIIRIIGEDGTIEQYAKINTRLPDGRTFNDISQGRYDVEVTTGPAYATKRQEAADSMMQFVQAVPAAGQVAADMIAKSMDWPNADKMAERLSMILPPGIDPEVDQKRAQAQQQLQQQMGPQEPDPMQELSLRGVTADVEGKEADATLKKIQAADASGAIERMIEGVVANRMGMLAGQMGIGQ